MKKLILSVILIILGWKAYERYGEERSHVNTTSEYAFSAQAALDDAPDIDIRPSRRSRFACDGRVYCSQMTSCDEAKYFVEHCPNVKMDGNHDGIPCEKHWCS